MEFETDKVKLYVALMHGKVTSVKQYVINQGEPYLQFNIKIHGENLILISQANGKYELFSKDGQFIRKSIKLEKLL